MNFKITIRNSRQKRRDLDNAKDYPTIADLMQEQKISNEQKYGPP